ncbi:hypothetical protein AB0A76_21600 [Streptomyces exfoliatus]|uniref:Lipoprotein n=1 Tax=Streptomyces exfoliatus TaxID=1905 RepID=A0ABV3CZY2_STREX
MNRRTAAAALSAALLGAVAGCGIQETDVVEAGGAATVLVAPIPENRIVLYFLGPDGRSMPVARDVGPTYARSTAPADGTGDTRAPYEGFGPGYEISDEDLRGSDAADKILAALLAGPGENETAAGLTTALPTSKIRGAGPVPRVTEIPAKTDSARPLFRLRAPFPVKELPEAAVRQLVCTTAYAKHPAGRVDVSVGGPDGLLPTARCDD